MKSLTGLLLAVLLLTLSGCNNEGGGDPVTPASGITPFEWSVAPTVDDIKAGQFTVTAGTVTGTVNNVTYWFASDGTRVPGYGSAFGWNKVSAGIAKTGVSGGDYVLYGVASSDLSGIVRSELVEFTLPYAKTYAVGDTGPGGGWIFYDDEADGNDDISGARYLEAAPANLSEIYAWGGEGESVSGADGTGIGTGIQNTADLIAAYPRRSYAANAADSYSVTVDDVVYADWFLPSKDELKAMYDVLHRNGVGGFSDMSLTSYWSSSVSNSSEAWSVGFTYGNVSDYPKDINYRVRPVRAF